MDDLRSTYPIDEEEETDSHYTPRAMNPTPDEEEEEDDDPSSTVPNNQTAAKAESPEGEEDDDDEDEEEEQPPHKKQKSVAEFASLSPPADSPPSAAAEGVAAKPSKKSSKKKGNNVWTKSATRKGKKKPKAAPPAAEDSVLITPIARFPDRSDDSVDAAVCLSKVYKAEKVELSEDRLSAGSAKGYRMVRATRGVQAGAWYFEIKVEKFGPTGHARLGWSTEKADLQAPVGYDAGSFAYRDLEGSKVHKAVREMYGEGYGEGDVVGFYINLPDGEDYAPKPPHYVWYKGQSYAYPADGKDEPPRVVPGSEISFFKNGVCQGLAFSDLCGGRYYPAASMFAGPNQPNCWVKFNFGPDFDYFPQDFGERSIPKPMSEAPYHGFYGRDNEPVTENGATPEQKP